MARPVTPITKKPDDPSKVGIFLSSSPFAQVIPSAPSTKNVVGTLQGALYSENFSALWVSRQCAARVPFLPQNQDEMVVHLGRVVLMSEVHDNNTLGWMRIFNTPFAVRHRNGSVEPLTDGNVVIDPERKEITFMNGKPTRVPLPL